MDRFLYFVLHIFLLIVGVTTRAANKYFDSRCSIAASLEHIIKLILKLPLFITPFYGVRFGGMDIACST